MPRKSYFTPQLARAHYPDLFPKTPSQSSASHTNQTPSSIWALLNHCARLILLMVSITVWKHSSLFSGLLLFASAKMYAPRSWPASLKASTGPPDAMWHKWVKDNRREAWVLMGGPAWRPSQAPRHLVTCGMWVPLWWAGIWWRSRTQRDANGLYSVVRSRSEEARAVTDMLIWWPASLQGSQWQLGLGYSFGPCLGP